MPRSAKTVTVSMGFNPTNAQIRQMQTQAEKEQKSLSAYVKQVVLDLTREGRFVALRFKEASQVARRLEQEAESVEMPMEAYILALLADRHRMLYEDKKAPSLWYPRVLETAQQETVPSPREEEVNLDEAMQNVSSLMDFYSDQEAFGF